MRRVRFSVAMSLDGYIAGPKGESDWIVIDPDIDFGALMEAFDTVLLGRKTYEATRQQGGGAAMPGVRTYVMSHCAALTELFLLHRMVWPLSRQVINTDRSNLTSFPIKSLN